MSNSRGGPGAAEHRPEPVVGFVATGENTDALVRRVVRAQHEGMGCLVTYAGPEPPAGATLAEGLGATLLPSETVDAGTETLEQLLVGAARMESVQGIILAPPGGETIDYERSRHRLRNADGFSARAVTHAGPDASESADLLVAIPAYNEAETIGAVVRDATAHADRVLVVDDGSTDGTVAAARDAGAEVVEHRTNRGYGAALKSAFVEADAEGVETLVVLDADGQHDASDIPRLVDRLEPPGTQVVIGSRFVDGSKSTLPAYREFGIRLVNVLTNLSLGVVRSESWVTDTQCGFRAYDAVAIETIAADEGISDGMGASTDLLYHAHYHDYGIAEVGTTVDYEVENANSHRPVRHGLTLVKNIVKTVERQRPLTALGIPGFVNTLFGFLLVYWASLTYNTTGSFPLRFGLLGLFCSLLGLLLCFTALILHSLAVYFSSGPLVPDRD